jgi:hypothetical protein
MIKLNVATDASGNPLYAPQLSTDIWVCNLLADTATSVSVPSGARIAVFGYASGNDYWVGTSTFSIPTSNSFVAANIYLNPPPLQFDSSVTTTLWLRAPVACKISISFYS